jgi:hypothetical protein
MSIGRSDKDRGSDRCAAPRNGAPAPLGRSKGPEDPLSTRNAKKLERETFSPQKRTDNTRDSLVTDPTTELALLQSYVSGKRAQKTGRFGIQKRAPLRLC